MNLLFFDFGSGEIFLIVLVIFLVFGPDKIPEMARKFGKFINEIKRASEDIKNEINREADKKERERKLQEYKDKISGNDNKSTAKPRNPAIIESVDEVKDFEDGHYQTGEGRSYVEDFDEDNNNDDKSNQ